jgi:DNA mismatch endonuclease, patch repair protein
MVDRLSPERRSRLMSRVRSKNTTPELIVRKLVHSLGYRFRLHRRDLPGSPDLVLPKHGSIIFVHGCFWHRHPGCRKASTSSTAVEFWKHKFERNVARDAGNEVTLRRMGWRLLVIWECETKDLARLEKRIGKFLTSARRRRRGARGDL